MFFHDYAIQALAPHLPLSPGAIGALLETPPDRVLGDIAFPCYGLAQKWRKAPASIATELATKLDLTSPLAGATAVGPYVNLRLDRPAAGKLLLEHVLAKPDAWGGSGEGEGCTVCIDFCSPNVARPLHLGHLRSTVIGKALSRLYATLGYRVVRINFLGDWGTQFGKLIAGWKRWGDQSKVQDDPIAELVRVYVRFHAEAKTAPALEAEGRAWFKRLEAGDREARALWEWIREQSLAGFAKTLTLLDVEFDSYAGEAFYHDKNQAVVDLLEARGLLVESEGAKVVELEGMPPCLILKSDGATLYETRDIAAAMHRQATYRPARSLYVVDSGQSLHFRQVFAVIERLGEPWAGNLEHVGFGVMRVGGKRLRTRAGEVVYLDDVLAQAIALAREELELRSPGMDGAEEIARSIGVGAVIFNDLRQHRLHDIDFDPDEAISFDGETGPYVQYAHARCRNVLRRAGLAPGEVEAPADPVLAGEPEWALLSAMAAFPAAVQTAVRRNEPHVLARVLLDTAKALSRFYHDCPVLKAGEGARQARLALVAATAVTLRRGLWMLGLEAPLMRAD
ncbi:MAG: arginine--tRNA ligase [Bacillota bacterium]